MASAGMASGTLGVWYSRKRSAACVLCQGVLPVSVPSAQMHLGSRGRTDAPARVARTDDPTPPALGDLELFLDFRFLDCLVLGHGAHRDELVVAFAQCILLLSSTVRIKKEY